MSDQIPTSLDRKIPARMRASIARGAWPVFDQLLVSKGLLSQNSPITVNEGTARIELFSEMVDHRVAQGPIRFGLPRATPRET